MSNVLIGFNNLANNCTLSGGSWVSTLPLNNLKDRKLYKIARSTDDNLSSTQFVVDFTISKVVKIFAVVQHNLSTTAKARLVASNDSGFGTLLYDSGFMSAWPITPSLEIYWEEDNWWFGIPTEEQIDMYKGITLWVVPSITARYWRVEIDDQSNASGYIELGRLFVSKDFSPVINASYGLSFSVQDNSEIEQSYGGAEHYSEKTKYRSVDFSLDALNEDEAFASWYRMMLSQGTTGEVLFVYDYSSVKYWLDRSFLGRIERSNPLTTPYFATWQPGATIKETV